MANSLGPYIAQQIKENMNLFFTSDLTEPLIEMLRIITQYIPSLLVPIQGDIIFVKVSINHY